MKSHVPVCIWRRKEGRPQATCAVSLESTMPEHMLNREWMGGCSLSLEPGAELSLPRESSLLILTVRPSHSHTALQEPGSVNSDKEPL